MKKVNIVLNENEAESLMSVLRIEIEYLQDFLSRENEDSFNDQLAIVEKLYQQLEDFSRSSS